MSTLRIICFLCLLACTACSLTGLESPAVTVTNLQLSEVTLFETGLSVDVRFQNPNEVDLDVLRGKHELSLNGVDIGTGYHAGRFSVPAYGSTVKPVSFTVSNLSVLTRLQRVLAANNLSYEVDSYLKTDRGSFSVSNEGSVAGVPN